VDVNGLDRIIRHEPRLSPEAVTGPYAVVATDDADLAVSMALEECHK
jgi:hypothetical protein